MLLLLFKTIFVVTSFRVLSVLFVSNGSKFVSMLRNGIGFGPLTLGDMEALVVFVYNGRSAIELYFSEIKSVGLPLTD